MEGFISEPSKNKPLTWIGTKLFRIGASDTTTLNTFHVTWQSRNWRNIFCSLTSGAVVIGLIGVTKVVNSSPANGSPTSRGALERKR